MLEDRIDGDLLATGSIDDVDYIELFSSPHRATSATIPIGSIATVRGWGIFANDSIPCTGAFVSVDNGPLLELSYGLERPDVANALEKPPAAFSGFRGSFSTGHLKLGTHALKVALRDDRGNFASLTSSASFVLVEALEQIVVRSEPVPGAQYVQVESLAIDGSLSTEPLRAHRGNVLRISGTALDPAVNAAGAAVFAIIGSTAFRAFYDMGSGHFSIDVPLSRAGSGARLVSSYFIGADRRTVYAGPSFRLDIIDDGADSPEDRGLTLGSVDEMAIIDRQGKFRTGLGALTLSQSDKLFVRGWAIDEKAGSVARSVSALIDGKELKPAVYGLERADVANALRLSDVNSCGFILVVAVDSLSYGSHVISFRVADRTASGYYSLARTIEFSIVESVDAILG